MARRPGLSDGLRRRLLAQCLERDGEIDLHLVLDDPERGHVGGDYGPVAKPTIDHVNGDFTDHRLENVVRIGLASNSREGNYGREGARGRLLSLATIEAARAKARELLASRATVPGSRGTQKQEEKEKERRVSRKGWDPAEDSASMKMDRTFCWYVFEIVEKEGFIRRHDAIHGGAQRVKKRVGRGSQQAVITYFQAIESREGWLVERSHEGAPAWFFRDSVDREALRRELIERIQEVEGEL